MTMFVCLFTAVVVSNGQQFTHKQVPGRLRGWCDCCHAHLPTGHNKGSSRIPSDRGARLHWDSSHGTQYFQRGLHTLLIPLGLNVTPNYHPYLPVKEDNGWNFGHFGQKSLFHFIE